MTSRLVGGAPPPPDRGRIRLAGTLSRPDRGNPVRPIATPRPNDPPPDPESGRIVTMAPVAALAALICVGIGVDFSGQALMEQALRDDAAHCARQVSTQMAAPTTPGHESAAAAVRQCLSQLGLTGKIEVDGATLTVTVDGRYATRLLSVVAIDNLPVHGVVTVTTRARR